MKIKSTEFSNNGIIPTKYSCDGEAVSPPLTISEVPEEAESLVLIVHDPDAPGQDFVHWLLWNIPPETKHIDEGVSGLGISGINDMRKTGYGPMCPPRGESHRYFFEVYALDERVNLREGSSRDELERAMEGHVVEQTEIIGLYKR